MRMQTPDDDNFHYISLLHDGMNAMQDQCCNERASRLHAMHAEMLCTQRKYVHARHSIMRCDAMRNYVHTNVWVGTQRQPPARATTSASSEMHTYFAN